MAESWLVIAAPGNQAAFQRSPQTIADKAIVFEVQTSADLVSVSWFLSGQKLATRDQPPFSVSWKPAVGQYQLVAQGRTIDDREVVTVPIFFSVLGFPP